MLEAMNWPYFIAGFLTCLLTQFLFAAWGIADFILRMVRKSHIADLIRWVLLTLIVGACFIFAVLSLADLFRLMAYSVRGVY